MPRSTRSCALLIVALTAPRDASAQAADPNRSNNRFREVALERARPALDGRGLFVTDRPAVLGHLQPGFGFWMSYVSLSHIGHPLTA